MRSPFLSGILLSLAVSVASADAPPTAPMTTGGPLPPEQYQVAVVPADIAPTAATEPPHAPVTGKPRETQGHPCTLWDKDDIADYKTRLGTSTAMQAAFATLKADADARIAKPLGVPVPQKAPDGNWAWPGDFLPGPHSPNARAGAVNEQNAKEFANLAIIYALTGDAKYGEFAKQMILAYADDYNSYGHPPGWTTKMYRSAVDGRITSQFLEDGFWLNEMAFGYDLIHDLPSFTPAQRTHIHDDLFQPLVEEFIDPVIADRNYLSEKHNRSALCAAGVLMAGYATDDPAMVNEALYGVAGTADKPTGGLLKVHFGECILPDGLWLEGAPTYQLNIVACALFNTAETQWHHGMDLYSLPGEPLKRILDSALALAYPEPKMREPALHDSTPMALLDDRAWSNNETGMAFAYGYRRYQDPRYIPVIENASQSLSMTAHAGPPSLFLDLPAADANAAPSAENANFFSVGYGVLRMASDQGISQLLQEYGPSAGHAHPSKLAIDFYALNDILLPLPGVIFPYNDPLDPKWYQATLGNCVLEVDELSQIYFLDRYKFPKDLPDPDATQLVYGPGDTLAVERAWSNTVYPGVTQDRSLFLTTHYLADLYGAFSASPHQYDLAWHLRGQMQLSLATTPFSFSEPVANGYNALTEVQHASTDQPWSATVTNAGGKLARFLSAGGTSTDVITGKGHYYLQSPKNDEFPPTILERREGATTVLYGNVVDVSGTPAGYVKSVAQEGGLDAGFGLLKIATVKGTDLCFAAFRPGSHSTNGLTTDAMQAAVLMDGPEVRSMYLGGGTILQAAGAILQRSDPGLACVEKTPAGTYLVSNPSPADSTVTVTLPALSGLKAFALDDQGKRTGPAAVTNGATAGSLVLKLKARSKVEFAAGP